MTAPLAHAPYAQLTPDLILTALEQLGIRTSGHLLALNSYENRVYQIGLDDDQQWGKFLVAKFYRPARWSDQQILEEHTFSKELAGYEVPVVAPIELSGNTLHSEQGFRFALFPRRGGRSPELDQRETREWIGRFLGRIHAVGQTQCFSERPTLDIQSYGHDSVAFLLGQQFIPSDLQAAYQSVTAQALDAVEHCFARAGKVANVRLHGDCHASNILWTDAGPHFVDFDDARNGPAIQDLWMLLSGERHEQQAQLNDILYGYEDFMDFDPSELHLLEALRTLRLLHYSAWLARRWDDPAFPAAFPWFNTPIYWQNRILELREQIALIAEGPLQSSSGNF
ncbi:serine/threonine protein kinase [Chitinibacter fontanus]|uniref:Stress response kinase A n=1 Tax=Chitinibacter fontanus TaxID=1737446 RepID=A0A7D5ZIC9_9NEIS|nr:serine/threonine protein kinase [Chitinibacter fontanus]QLI82409.1 serine/threonine protein kinase [Chitinibacter fontanus]